MNLASTGISINKEDAFQAIHDKLSVLKGNMIALVVPLVLLATWETFSRLGYIRPTILPAPSVIAKTLLEMLKSGEIFLHLGVSILRVAQGFVLGASLGIIVGIIVALSVKIAKAVSLIFGVLRPIPVIAWIPALILWLGIDEASKITVIAIGSFWTVLINVIQGIKNTDKKYLEVATILEKNRYTLLTKVILPSALPSIFTGLRVGIDVSWRSVVAAELIAAASGIGYLINYARELSQTDAMLVGVLSIGITGMLIDFFLKKFEKRLLRWNVNILS